MSGGFLILFQIQQKMVKKEIKKQIIAGLPEHQLKIFKFSANENEFQSMGLKWIEENEFIFEGKMYDVVKFKNVDNEKWFYCFEDTRETALTAMHDKLLEDFQNKPLEKNSINLLIHLLTTPFEIQLFRSTANRVAIIVEPHHYLFKLKTWTTLPAYHPPRF
jgi:hypothetical protein